MHDGSPSSAIPGEPHSQLKDAVSLTKPIEGKRIKRSDLLNLLNFVNFREGTIFVSFKHRERGNLVFFQARPLPCSDDTLVCSWVDAVIPLERFSAFDCDSLILSDGRSHISVKADLLSLDSKGASFKIPLSGYESSLRSMNRNACLDIQAGIIQAGMRYEGLLEDFNPVSFKVRMEEQAPDTLRWVNPDSHVTVMLSRRGTLLFSGECLVTRIDKLGSNWLIVLTPDFSNVRRYRPRVHRSERYVLVPAATIRFDHPLTGKRVFLKTENISGTGLCVEEFLESSVLVPGLIIPEIIVEIANNLVLGCRAQVLYRNVVRTDNGRPSVRCGIVFLDMQPVDQVRLTALIHQSVDEKLRVCSSIEMDELWRFFFESGFIYPSKYLSLQARKEEFKKTYRRLYLESPSIARHFFFLDKGQIYGHMSMLRAYSNSWIIHHHAASRTGNSLAGVMVLDEMGRFTNDVHLHPSAHMDYLMSYYRRENHFPAKVFGNVAQDVANPKGSSLDTFGYLWPSAFTETDSEPFQLFPARQDDLAELARWYESISGGLMLDALDLGMVSGIDSELSAEYVRQGFKRERQVFTLKLNGKVLAVLLLTVSDIGLNLSNLTNCIHALVLESELLHPSMLFSAIHALMDNYGSDEPPILVFPEDYLDTHAIPCDKKYTLWILDTSFADAYFDSVRSTFRRTCRDQDA
ncbi:MAG TPA: PilZ domain-containing protein [bacterium]|nr:PilZ domain-containing protein [bacterium]